MLQMVFKSVILAWLLLLVFCLFGIFPDHAHGHHIWLPLVMIPIAGGLSGFVNHLLDRSKSKFKLKRLYLQTIQVFVFLILVGFAFALGFGSSY